MGIRKYNFNPGPAALPVQALETARGELLDYKGAGMSVMEISHRSKEFSMILDDVKSSLTLLMDIPDTHEVLFLQGGASLQFAMIPMNFLSREGKADYIVTGTWSKKAVKEARLFGQVNIAADMEVNGKFTRVPRQSELTLDPGAVYVHITSNNTIAGTQFHDFPQVGDKPLMADMSSDILSRKIDVKKFGIIYAGAQKNLGPAGVTVVIIRKTLTEKIQGNVPTLLNYQTHLEKNSLFNTPPCWSIYMVSLVARWVEEQGGLDAMEKLNTRKAEILYGTIDKYPDFYTNPVEKDSRSMMNVTFRLPSEDLEKEFIEKAAENNLHGLKGHRSVGGCRASIYNAFPLEGVEKLVDFMKKFRETH